MKAVKRRGQATLPAKKDMARSTRQEQITKVTGAQAVVERVQRTLAEIELFPILKGKLGCEALDCLELVDKFRTKYRDQVKELLLKEPDAIPGWHVAETPTRTLSKNTLKVFIAAAHADNGLSCEEFITACTTNLSALRKLLADRNPEWSADELEYALNRTLVDLVSFQKVTRLSRSKTSGSNSRYEQHFAGA